MLPRACRPSTRRRATPRRAASRFAAADAAGAAARSKPAPDLRRLRTGRPSRAHRPARRHRRSGGPRRRAQANRTSCACVAAGGAGRLDPAAPPAQDPPCSLRVQMRSRLSSKAPLPPWPSWNGPCTCGRRNLERTRARRQPMRRQRATTRQWPGLSSMPSVSSGLQARPDAVVAGVPRRSARPQSARARPTRHHQAGRRQVPSRAPAERRAIAGHAASERAGRRCRAPPRGRSVNHRRLTGGSLARAIAAPAARGRRAPRAAPPTAVPAAAEMRRTGRYRSSIRSN